MNLARRLIAAALICIALPGAHLAHLQASRNFHPIVAAEAYRSAQPTGADLARWQARTGIRSVINLRGSHAGADWYDDEVAASRRLGLAHYDFGMSAGRELMPQAAARLVALLRAAPKPVLIHCKSGADRTGLAAALYLAQRGTPEDLAEAQISFRFGHVSIPFTAAWPMDASWEHLEASFGYES